MTFCVARSFANAKKGKGARGKPVKGAHIPLTILSALDGLLPCEVVTDSILQAQPFINGCKPYRPRKTGGRVFA